MQGYLIITKPKDNWRLYWLHSILVLIWEKKNSVFSVEFNKYYTVAYFHRAPSACRRLTNFCLRSLLEVRMILKFIVTIKIIILLEMNHLAWFISNNVIRRQMSQLLLGHIKFITSKTMFYELGLYLRQQAENLKSKQKSMSTQINSNQL